MPKKLIHLTEKERWTLVNGLKIASEIAQREATELNSKPASQKSPFTRIMEEEMMRVSSDYAKMAYRVESAFEITMEEDVKEARK